MSLILDEHREYLQDEHRVSAYRRAIREVVRPGDVVMDLGAGTGVLGMMACEAGAKRVYSVEGGGMIQMARKLIAANGFQDRVICIKGLSTRVNLPEKVDVVVADQIGRFGFEPGVLQLFEDVKRRLLKPEGRTVPSTIELWAAPVEVFDLWSNIDFWSRKPAGFDFAPAGVVARNTGYPVRLERSNLLGAPARLCSLEATSAAPFRAEAALEVERAGTLHGIGGWFSAQLSRQVVMTNSPLSEERIGRRDVYFPIENPLEVRAGDRLKLSMSVMPAEVMVTSKLEVCDALGAEKGRFTFSVFKGMLLTEEQFKVAKPEFVPRLSPWGLARRSVVDLCDGKRNLREIEREVWRLHPDLFPTIAQAQQFVAEVMIPYASGD